MSDSLVLTISNFVLLSAFLLNRSLLDPYSLTHSGVRIIKLVQKLVEKKTFYFSIFS